MKKLLQSHLPLPTPLTLQYNMQCNVGFYFLNVVLIRLPVFTILKNDGVFNLYLLPESFCPTHVSADSEY